MVQLHHQGCMLALADCQTDGPACVLVYAVEDSQLARNPLQLRHARTTTAVGFTTIMCRLLAKAAWQVSKLSRQRTPKLFCLLGLPGEGIRTLCMPRARVLALAPWSVISAASSAPRCLQSLQ